MTAPFDPRAVMVALIVSTVAIFASGWQMGLVFSVVLIGGCVQLHRVQPERAMVYVVIAIGGTVAFVLNAWLIRTGDTVMSAPVTLTADGVTSGARFALRVINLGLLAQVVRRVTALDDLPEAVGAIGTSIGIRHPALHRGVFSVRLALRFLPVLLDEGRDVLTSLRLRGLWPHSRIGQIRSVPRLIIPLWVRTLVRADRVALLLDARGINPAAARPYLANHRWRRRDSGVVAASVLALVAGLGVR